jgi:hypothetical protein
MRTSMIIVVVVCRGLFQGTPRSPHWGTGGIAPAGYRLADPHAQDE